MTFLLKYPRVMTVTGFVRQAEFAFKKKNFYLSLRQYPLKVNQTFVRFFAAVPERSSVPNESTNIKENLYQKSVTQLYFDIRYKGYTFKEDFNKAWYTLRFSNVFTSEQTVLLIKSCGHSLPLETQSEKLKLIKEVWDSFDAVGIKKTIAHYNALLYVYIELEYEFSPEEFLSNLENQGLVPNLETYSKLLHALGIQGKIDLSQTFLEHMKRHSMSIDDKVFNSLILGYSLKGDFVSAGGILELMKEKQLFLSSKSYLNLAMGYAKQGDIEKVKEIILECNIKTSMSVTELLELAYTFAVNKHSEPFCTILYMIPVKKNFLTVSAKVIHRLLHQNLDKEALKLFEFRDRLDSISLVQEHIQMFLKHYVKFRTPDEVLKTVEIFTGKGWAPIALPFCLKETLILKDISHCLDFIRALKTWGYPVRIHYFYPVLLKAHRFGNEKVIKLVKCIKSYNVNFGREAVKAFHYFYDFRPGAEFEDFEKLKSVGLEKKLIAWKILDILLNRKNFDSAIKLVSTCGVAYPAVNLPDTLATSFKEFEDDYEKFVDILYYLIHNLKANKMLKKSEAEVKPIEYEQFIVAIAQSCSEKFNIGAFEQMLKKKIPFSSGAASYASRKFPSPQVIDLISKLTSKDLKFEFDKTILNRLLELDWKNEQKQEFSEKKGVKEEWSFLLSALEKKKSLSVVMRLFQVIAQKQGLQYDEKHKNILKKLLKFVSLEGDAFSAEKIYKFGMRNNLIKAEDYSFCVDAYLVRGNVDKAIKRFYEGLELSKNSIGLEFLIKEIMKRNYFLALEDLQVLMRKVLGENYAATQLLKSVANLGWVDEAKKILQSKMTILKPRLKALSQKMYKKGNLTFFETLEKASRNTTDLNINFLYYFLLKLYVFNKNLEKILNLHVELNRDDAMNTVLCTLFLNIYENWSFHVPESLDKILQCAVDDCKAKKFNNTALYTPRDFSSFENNINIEPKKRFLPSFDNSWESVSSSNKSKDLFECFCLIHAGKLDEYFEILRKKIVENRPAEVKDYFFCYELIPYIKKNPKYLDKYEKLVFMSKHSDPLKKYLKLCLGLDYTRGIILAVKKLHPAELQVFLEHLKIKDFVRVVNNKNCNRQMRKEIIFFYSKIINQYLKENNLRMARIYYENAKNHKLGLKISAFEDSKSSKYIMSSKV